MITTEGGGGGGREVAIGTGRLVAAPLSRQQRNVF